MTSAQLSPAWRHVVGFDARPYPSPAPASVDEEVWPSIFSVDALGKLAREQAEKRYSAWSHGAVQHLWDDLAEMRRVLNSTQEAPPHQVVAFEVLLFEDDCPIEEEYWPSRTKNVRPPGPSVSWQLLGYDVADYYLLSLVSNDATRHDPVLRSTTGRRYLLEARRGLFLPSSLRTAYELSRIVDEASGYGPFYVFGVWVV
jgi:hypothetical protein